MTSKVVWESPEKKTNGESYIKVKKADNYYLYTERAGKDSVAFILYDKNKNKFGLVKEIKPPLYEEGIRHLITAFGGSLDKDISKEEIVKEEVLEEAGFEVDLSKIKFIGKYFVSTQMNQWCYLYVVDVSNAKYVGQRLEAAEDAQVVWKSVDEILELNDWKSIVIISQLNKYKIIKG
jgi:8-oxo-dGTP pyrophosphatase MutT (NUDIX family)